MSCLFSGDAPQPAGGISSVVATNISATLATILAGSGHNDSIKGGAANDTLYGFVGNDTLDGGGSSDTAARTAMARPIR